MALAADPDGEANDCRLVPQLLPRTGDRIAGPRLWVADRQFCGSDQIARFAEDGDHYLIRQTKEIPFHADPARAAGTGTRLSTAAPSSSSGAGRRGPDFSGGGPTCGGSP